MDVRKEIGRMDGEDEGINGGRKERSQERWKGGDMEVRKEGR